MNEAVAKGRACPVGFDHAAVHPRAQLLEWGDKLREGHPIAWSESHGGVWIVSRHADIQKIASQPDIFVSGKGITIPPLQSPVPVVPAESDEPEHSHYRGALWEFLKPKAVKAYSDKIRALIVEALDGLIAKGEGDAIADFAARIPTRAMATVFGFSDEDAFRFDRDFGEVVESASSNDPERQGRAVENFFGFLKEKLAEGRAGEAGDNVVAAILGYEKDGYRFNEEEMLGLLWSTAGGAVDTTKHSLGHFMYNLGIRPDLRRELIENPRLITIAVEENLRMDAPAYMTARHVVSDVKVGDVEMRAGDRVMLVYGFGNRDERAFECPNDFRLDRKANNHLSFGHGIHTCIGMHLARIELKIAVEEVLSRIPDFELIEPVPEPKIRGGLMWAFDSLPVRVNAGSAK